MISILYIEDNADNIKLVKRVLRAEGYPLHVATDGATGLRLALQEKPTLILLDINLPDMDGFEVVARLRADAITQDIPVIALTANALKGDYEKCLQAGCNDYIAKPLRIETLSAKIRAFVSSSAASPTTS